MAKKTLKNRKSRRRTLRRKTKGGSTSIPTAALKVSEGGLNTDNKWHGI